MKNLLSVVALCIFTFSLQAQVQTSYLWHLHQPTYWGDVSLSNPNRSQLLKESQDLKMSGQNTYSDGLAHPLNDLEQIFSLPDRVQAYQYKPKNAVQSIMGYPKAGAQITYGGSLLESINSLAPTGQWGYQPTWKNNIITAKSWMTSGNNPRFDILNFTMHHTLSPLVSDEVLRKEIQAFRYYAALMFNSQTSKGYWPAECAFSERIIKTLVEEGIEWSVIANSHLARTLSDYPLVFGTNGCNIDPPNRADKVTTAGVNWHNGQIDGRGGQFAAPYCFTPHKARYVDPATGTAFTLDIVPMAELDSYRDGYSPQGISNLQNNIAPYALANRPSLVLLAHDGDNAWGGGSSYYDEAVPGFTNAAAGAGYTPTTIQQYLSDYPVPATDIVHVEDGSWFNAANDWGSPQFINWLWPFYDTNQEFNPNGWTEDVRNQAVMIAAENHCVMAEELEGGVQIADIVNPTASSSPAEKAWHFLMPGLDSGNAYYGDAIDLEIKATIAANNAVIRAQPTLDANAGVDTTKPTVFIPQRYPYNPGEIGFGPNYGYQQKLNTADFTVWTLAYDVNDIAEAVVKYRIDGDGTNNPASDENETYFGGTEVGAWQSLPMTERIFPTGNITNNPNISFFILPNKIANQYSAKIVGISNKLVDYYVEVTDTFGNVNKTAIQHVWVGTNLNVNPTVAFTPENPYSPTPITVTMTASDSTDPTPVLYYTIDGSDPTVSSPSAVGSVQVPITQTTTFKAFAKDVEGNISPITTKTYFIGETPSFTVHVKAPASWSTVRVHYWNATPTGVLTDTAWPGVLMTADCDGWYHYTFTGVTSVNVVFNNGSGGSGNQTADLVVQTDAWYDVTSASWVSGPTSGAPCLTIAPPGGTFTVGNTVNVTLTATDNDSQPLIYYTVDGSTPTDASTAVASGFQLPISTTTTLKAFAKDMGGNASPVKTETYQFIQQTGFTVYFKPPAGWPTPKIYYWNVQPTSAMPSVTWPGVTMTAATGGWYSFTFSGVTSVNLIFNNGNGGVGVNQTVDITGITSELWYDWALGPLSNPEFTAALRVTLFPNPSNGTVGIQSDRVISRVTLYDLEGRKVSEQQPVSGTFNIQSLAEGTYIARLETQDRTVVTRYVIRRN
ncbi:MULTISPECIES: starch-binding protein [unclassified Flavobacterium]|uniref:starch-binding protein n=1 Tax=unclassified Flavobacterium TaxID=196869 RepID=UPI001F12A60E|nr:MULTISPECIES: starch-binding protein [unclassified Flavobacterium]UMY66904.1 starch-binding protein [Flavobacterium sp. HJ-32-4]